MEISECYFVIATNPKTSNCDVYKYKLYDFFSQEQRETELIIAKLQYNRCVADKKYSYVQFVNGTVHCESKLMS